MAINEMIIRGYIKRVNDRAMFGKQKAVTGETELPLTFLQSSIQGANGKKSETSSSFNQNDDKISEYFF